MRIWHYQLLKYLPDSLMKTLWEDLQRVFKGERDVFTNFIDEEDDVVSLFNYSMRLFVLMDKRKIEVSDESTNIFTDYFEEHLGDRIDTFDEKDAAIVPFVNIHTPYYLMYCGSLLNEYFELGLEDYDEELNHSMNVKLNDVYKKMLQAQMERQNSPDDNDDGQRIPQA